MTQQEAARRSAWVASLSEAERAELQRVARQSAKFIAWALGYLRRVPA